jgi:hypothetical protein
MKNIMSIKRLLSTIVYRNIKNYSAQENKWLTIVLSFICGSSVITFTLGSNIQYSLEKGEDLI